MTSSEPRWVAFVRGTDRTGTLTALAGVFSTRGVNFDSLSTGGVDEGDRLIVITFVASERRRRLLIRTVERLSVVRSVQVLSAEDPSVRAAGVVHLPEGVAFTPPDGTGVWWSGDPASGRPLLVEGQLAEVEVVVAHALARGAFAVATVILPPPGDPVAGLE
jgi:acetolactate synthase regulatory subunit